MNLMREQAITILKQYTNEEEIIFPYSFPYQFVPNNLGLDEWELENEIEIRNESLKYIIKKTIELFFPKSVVISQTNKETIFMDDLINYHKIINDLNKAQEEFDKINNDEKDLSTYVNQMSFIQKHEIIIIEKAEKLLELKEIIDSKTIQFGKEIMNKNTW
jgi:hypothetical protein